MLVHTFRSNQEKLARTAFWSVVGWGMLLGLFEFLRPGFVSRYLPFYWIPLIILATAIWWGSITSEIQEE
ncbi:MAG TPA: hypothetical protein VJB99_01235 [Patescibacteria group bacterium]|nr:hypothetical protein [Patescibacteria group bacterium]